MAMEKAEKTNHDFSCEEEEEVMPLPYLTQYLVVKILSKLPVKSLLRFKCVSKQWRSLISDPYFIQTHLNQSLAKSSSIQTQHNILLIATCCFPYRLYTARSAGNDDDDNIVVAKMDFLFQGNPRCQIRGSCNGLICMQVVSSPNCSTLKLNAYVFNLSTRECRQIPYCDDLPGGNIVGFGYDHCHDDYKLVNIHCNRVSVHSMRHGRWRKVQEFPNFDFHVFPTGTQLNGAIHWIRMKKPNKLDLSQQPTFEIAAFSLVDEKLWMIPLPSTNFHKARQVGVFEGCLCMLPCCEGALWVMKEYGVEQSWTKIDIKLPIFSDMLTLLRNETLIDYTKSVLFNRGGPLVIHDHDKEEDVDEFRATICVDSLLSPFMKMKVKEEANNFG